MVSSPETTLCMKETVVCIRNYVLQTNMNFTIWKGCSACFISLSFSLYFCSQGSPGDFEADESGNMLGILLTPEYLIREREARRNASRCNPRVTQKSLQTTESSSKAPWQSETT